jgi:hypothetical protein
MHVHIRTAQGNEARISRLSCDAPIMKKPETGTAVRVRQIHADFVVQISERSTPTLPRF